MSADTLEIGSARLEARWWGPSPADAPTIVMLHEGLGCLSLWGDFPTALAKATGLGVFTYSRAGYGASTRAALPRPVGYMHDEAFDVLPKVLDTIGFRRGLLLGHSDGASIAAIYAGGVQDHRIRGLTLMAPHFFTEETGLASIARAKAAYETGDLRSRLARHHVDVDNAFRGWSDAWLAPGFRAWDIREYLGYVRVPLQIIQGADDEYGTVAQIEVAAAECTCPLDVALMPTVRHSPHREAPAETVAAVTAFAHRIFHLHEAAVVPA